MTAAHHYRAVALDVRVWKAVSNALEVAMLDQQALLDPPGVSTALAAIEGIMEALPTLHTLKSVKMEAGVHAVPTIETQHTQRRDRIVTTSHDRRYSDKVQDAADLDIPTLPPEVWSLLDRACALIDRELQR